MILTLYTKKISGFFLASYLSDGDGARALELAARAAAVAVGRPGAAPSIPSREEVLAQIGAKVQR